MRRGKVIFLVLIGGLLLTGCASKLGYPARSVGIPTPVTLFSRIAPNASLNMTMPIGARDLWSMLYKKKFEEILAKISRENLKRQLDIGFSKDAGKAKDLFSLGSSEVLDIGVDYAKTKADPPAYSGFDFSGLKDTIPTQYVLALTIDEWGLIAAQRDKENGPFISMTIQLIDKDTNMSAWKYNYQFQQQVDKDANELTEVDPL
ncbi:MAG: hypothetical protein ABSG21_18155, partial [Spirochaetia bacterium]